MDTISVKLASLDDKVMFSATARDNPQVVIDYFPPVGTGNGYTSLELLMASYGSCLSTAVLTILRHKMKKAVNGVSVEITGTVRDQHPKALQHMQVALTVRAADLCEAEVRQAIQVSEEIFCPVWAMIKGNVEITIDVTICEPY